MLWEEKERDESRLISSVLWRGIVEGNLKSERGVIDVNLVLCV